MVLFYFLKFGGFVFILVILFDFFLERFYPFMRMRRERIWKDFGEGKNMHKIYLNFKIVINNRKEVK